MGWAASLCWKSGGRSVKEFYDCEPTLDDFQVLEFCKQGFLVLEGVVPDEVNRRTVAFLEGNTCYEPTEILAEPWFVDAVVKNPAAAGAVRALLGADFGLPILMSNHRGVYPNPGFGGWHRDGGSKHGHELHNLQVFYIPEDCTPDCGPTEVLPWSHHLYSPTNYMQHLNDVRGARLMTGPAGTIFITVYQIWHRRSPADTDKQGVRNLLKYNYYRTAPPERDWGHHPDFDFAEVDYGVNDGRFRVQFRDAYDACEMFLWLCGRHELFQVQGGQTWPIPLEHRTDKPYGIPKEFE
jgi:hypothetical protein